MVMPKNIIERYLELPSYMRWLIISILACAVILWVFFTVVIAGLNHYIETRGAFLKDALYLPYGLETRALPALPETIDPNAPFVVLPDQINNQYILQIPPSREEIRAQQLAERDAFWALSVPVEKALIALQKELDTTLQANEKLAAEMAAAAPVAAPAEGESAGEAAPAVEAQPTIMPTVDPVRIQLTAVNIALADLVMINDTLADAVSLEPVRNLVAPLLDKMNGVTASGVVLAELDPFNAHLAALAAQKPPAQYLVNDCLMASKMPVRRSDLALVPPCTIDQTATFVESGTYLYNDMPFRVGVAQYPDHESATTAIKSVYWHALATGRSGNFTLGMIEYDYFFSYVEGQYAFTWSHDNWVFSVAAPNPGAMEALVKALPF
jgi:hypothetical protein